MKKSILYSILGVTLIVILVIFSFNSNKIKSLNGFLEYKLPSGWVEPNDYTGLIEIIVQNEDASIELMAEYIEYAFDTTEDFLTFQEYAIIQLGAVFVSEDFVKLKNKTFSYKVYEITDDLGEYYQFISGIVEFDGNDDIFLGVVATISGYENSISEIISFLNSIELTNITISDERVFSLDENYLEITLPAQWKRFERGSEFSFYKSGEIGILYSYTMAISKEEIEPLEYFDYLSQDFEFNFYGAKVFLSNTTQDLGDRTITSMAYEYDLDGLIVYSYFSVIDFVDSNLFAVCNFDIATETSFEDLKEELDFMVNSIKIKKGAEKQYEKDMKALEEEKNTFIDELEYAESIFDEWYLDEHDHDSDYIYDEDHTHIEDEDYNYSD